MGNLTKKVLRCTCICRRCKPERKAKRKRNKKICVENILVGGRVIKNT